ncbi:MAG: hypothetical protein AAFN93_20315 [Bacteroidota bacterium]
MIEDALRLYPSYGHKRLIIHLLLMMKLFGIKPYRRTAKKCIVYKYPEAMVPNFFLTESLQGRGDIWANEFTYIKYHDIWAYVATVIDVYTREIVSVSMMINHTAQLVINP